MKIGTLDITRRPVSYRDSVLLRRAWRATAPPHDFEIELAALGLSTVIPGCPDQGRLDYAAFGRLVDGVLRTSGATDAEIVLAARLAFDALPAETIAREEVERWADFFGIAPGSSPASDSESGTAAGSR